MSQQYDNEMRGVLFKNAQSSHPAAPQAKGECQIDGVRYWVSAWTKTKQDGEKYQQLKLERADAKYQPNQQQQQGGAAPAPTAESLGMAPGTDPDDIPF